MSCFLANGDLTGERKTFLLDVIVVVSYIQSLNVR
jgi:hypothetical protein